MLLLALSGGVATAGSLSDAAGAGEACPAHGRLPQNRWAETETSLMPPQAVSIRVCRYAPNPGALTLKASHLVTRRGTIAWMTQKLDALPPASGVAACPNDSGGIALVLADYPGPHAASVSIRLTGCRNATNRHLTSSGLNRAGFLLVHRLQALTRSRR